MQQTYLFFLLIFLSTGLQAQEKHARNPVIFADVPDMSIVRVGKMYYMSSTTMHLSPGVPIMKSTDLVNWKLVNYAYDTLGDVDALNLKNGANAYGRGSWASCLRYHKGLFYVSTFAATTGKTYIYKTKDIEKGPWERIAFEPSYHDHTIFFDDDGKTYMIWGVSKLKMVELQENLSGVKAGTERVLIENASAPAGDNIMLGAEGSQLFKVNGKYYLFNITWPRGGMRTVIIHRADQITGPYEGRLALQDLGVAQGGLIDTPDGHWYAYLFRDYGGVGRIPYLVPVKWEDGWPVLGLHGKAPEMLDLPAGKGLIPGIAASDEFARKKGQPALPLVWQWNHNPDPTLWSVTERKGYLRLRTGRTDTSFVQARNTLTQRTIGPVCSGATSLDVSNMKEGDFAGLCLLQKNYGLAGVKIKNGSKSVVMVTAASGKAVEVQSVPLTQNTIYFKAECNFKDRADVARFFYSLDGKSWKPIGEPLKMPYTLPHFMGYRFGLFNYATQQTGGFADFDFFRLEDKIVHTGSEVGLLDGPFKHARDLNIQTLLQYDTDRLLAPYRKQSGLSPKAPGYPNWDGLDGHVGGHYLSAMAMNYAATGNAECKTRLDYMLAELKTCQDANASNHPEWGAGYLGGVPNSDTIWATFKKGDFTAYRAAWVPWYNVHKMYAGLRDAWLYTGNEAAKTMFLHFCDWGLSITAALSDEQMQAMLDTEHGGMNEVFADAYQMTGHEKYLTAAKRFSHKMLLDPMSAGQDNLDNKHANTQIPKVIGFQRIAALSGEAAYARAARFFWETVTRHRSLALGGNSRRESFPGVAACGDFADEVQGPESCNSYNMLKLTERLFRSDPQAEYADYYERTLFNHILSTQHPETGGYVYFTPARPRHYRVYSTPNQAMWCCVGSGMENHGKYNEFIYTPQNDSLFLNLFIASELNWREKGVRIRQETIFPNEEQTRLNITEGAAHFTLMIRYPSWVKDGVLEIKVNNKPVAFTAHPSSYVAIDRLWKKGDVVDIKLPMHTTTEQMPNVPEYLAFMHGPILLGAKTGTEDLKGLFADAGRWGQIAGGERLPLDKAPIIIEDHPAALPGKLTPVKGQPLTFTAPEFNMINPVKIVLEPFYQIHDARYMMYWMALTQTQYKFYLDSIAAAETEKLALQKRTVDFVATGEQQPEADHAMQNAQSNAGSYRNEFWRDAANGGYFSYQLTTNSEVNLTLRVRYWGAEWGSRKFDIYIDGEKLVSEDNTNKWNQSKFQEIEYPIPDTMLQGKKDIRIKFQALPHNTAGAVYGIRLLRNK